MVKDTKCDGHDCPYDKVCYGGCENENNMINQYQVQVGAYMQTMTGTLLEDNDVWALYKGPTGKLIACRVDIHRRGRGPTQLNESNTPPGLIRWTEGETVPESLNGLVEKYKKD